jgi:uncharacterized protein (TIGR02594 family)
MILRQVEATRVFFEESNMRLDRRSFLVGATASFVTSAQAADDRLQYREYNFKDYFSLEEKGTYPSDPSDIEKANQIADRLSKDDHFKIMRELSQITDTGSTTEVFNERWRKFANPLIVRFFHDVGYKKTPYPGDCTPWCAATTSWCLKRAGFPLPPDPASSQSFLRYGTRVSEPREGDLCVFTDVNDRAHGHVGMFVKLIGGVLTVLGGNQAGQSTTNCGSGYRQSKIAEAEIPVNAARKRSVGVHYLAAYVRAVKTAG